MARTSRLVEALILAEDVLLFFNDYFKSTSWLNNHCGLPEKKIKRSKWYLVKKNILDKDLSLKQKPKTVYREITKPWDQYWRMVIYDIPEEKRNLRDKIYYLLGELGFEKLQRSVWLSPFTASWIVRRIEQLVDDPENLLIFKTKLSKEKSYNLIDSLWPIDEWEYKTNNFISEIKEKKKITTREQKFFWDLVAEHPKIPLDLLPRNWPLKKLANLFCKYG
jgi:phenylacetic acid degradation operon negative regulatory protein